jgi:hypothetical protein
LPCPEVEGLIPMLGTSKAGEKMKFKGKAKIGGGS